MELVNLAVVILSLPTPIPVQSYLGSYYCEGGWDVMVHLFEWKHSEVARECQEFLADTGYCGVQVSFWLLGSLNCKEIIKNKICLSVEIFSDFMQWFSSITSKYSARYLLWTSERRSSMETIRIDPIGVSLVAEVPACQLPLGQQIWVWSRIHWHGGTLQQCRSQVIVLRIYLGKFSQNFKRTKN